MPVELEGFLADYENVRSWTAREGAAEPLLRPLSVFFGHGDYALEVGLAEAIRRPRVEDLRRLWKERHGGRPNPLLIVAAYQDGSVDRATLCGPVGESPPVIAGLELAQVERLCAAALAEPTRHIAVRFLVSALDGLGSELLPGIRNVGMLATQELRTGVPERSDWRHACNASARLLRRGGRQLVEGLGFEVEVVTTTASVLTANGAKRAVAVFLDDTEGFEEAGARFSGASPVSHGLAVADRENLPWVILTRGRQIRLYSARPDLGVGRKGRAETFVELNLALLPEAAAGYLTLLFGPNALAAGGTFEDILARSADFAADLGKRLRERVYFDVVPSLATAVAARMTRGRPPSEADLVAAYEQTLIMLFRLLFTAYAEDKDLVPYRTNSVYAHHALKSLARELADRRRKGPVVFDQAATDLWASVRAIWQAVDKGNADWGVPAYDGGLFSEDPSVSPSGAALAGIELTNAEFGPALLALLVDEGEDEVLGPVDFRSLSVREFGTIYEGLLEGGLSVATTDLRVDRAGTYLPVASSRDPVEVQAGEIYFHDRSGARKSTGSYFTKPFAVEHLLDHALEPVLDEHLQRLAALLEAGDEAGAAEAFLDFRCVDLAMGSGHFLVAAVDRIEARLSGFLALHPIPAVTAEVERLRTAALDALGDLADGVEIEQTSLLRRQVARRCIYGVDLNGIAVELARLAIWIHTFVPGLPLSFLDHNLVSGNSLTGIATLEEALELLDPEANRDGQLSMFRDALLAFLGRAQWALRRLAAINEATTRDVAAARAAHTETLAAVEPARQLFDILVAARLRETGLPPVVDKERIAAHPGRERAQDLARRLRSLHFPVVFPEVFLRDRPGFDCILGNPPWEEVMVDEHAFWALRFPGIRAMSAGAMKQEIARLRRTRRDLVTEYESEVSATDQMRAALSGGQYPQMNQGNADLYKAFCWRFWALARDGGAVGVVLPRTALSGAGTKLWREAILSQGAFNDVTMLLNTGGWAFDDVHGQYVVCLVSARKGEDHVGTLRLQGPFSSLVAFENGQHEKPTEFAATDFQSWSEASSFPVLPLAESADLFVKLRRYPNLGSRSDSWRARPLQGDFNATTDKQLFILEVDHRTDAVWPVYKGGSFNLWEPDTGIYYAWADPDEVLKVLQERRRRGQRNARSPFNEFDQSWSVNPDTLPCRYPRIAFRDVTNRLNTRTTIAALIPGHVILTNQAPYLLWPEGDKRDEAYLLGALSSIVLDWYARCVVERHLNFHLFNAFPIPRPRRDNAMRRRVEQLAGRLASVDNRYEQWAEAVGVPVRALEASEKEDLIAELDAAIALLYGLEESDIRHIFETFHVGWDFTHRLQSMLAHYKRLREKMPIS
jgi:hypothetical protein